MRSAGLRAGPALGLLGLLGLVALLASGCSSVGYLAQAAQGHASLLRAARPVDDVLADAATPPALRERLLLSQRMRAFASDELALPQNNSYRRYADLAREAVVWNVVAAPALALELKSWCFPLFGCVGYRGFFAREAAEGLAAQLRAQGFEVDVYGVPAYSTLGFSNWAGGDPLLNTFINWPEGQLAQLIFHELAHQVAYADDDTPFNESYATAVERLGGERWLQRFATPDVRAAHAAAEVRRQQFRSFMQHWKGALQAVYASADSADHKTRRKAETMAAMRAAYGELKAERWAGFSGWDAYVARANNATFAVQAAYNELVPQFEALFVRLGSRFERLHAEVRILAALPRRERRARLVETSSLR